LSSTSLVVREILARVRFWYAGIYCAIDLVAAGLIGEGPVNLFIAIVV